MQMAARLFIPGPSDVDDTVLRELARPQLGHRTQEFRELFASLRPGLRKLFSTGNDVLISTSSGSGLWEAAIRSCVKSKVLHAVNGAFSKKWASLSKNCAKDMAALSFQDGKPVNPQAVDKALSERDYEAFCVVHNETSTGVISDLGALSQVMKKHPDVLFFVDAVSSLGGVKIEVDGLGIDICLASSQKALALPAGIALASISRRSYLKAEAVEGRGYYFDLLELKKAYDKDETPYTPSIPHLYALRKQLDRMEAEGLEFRYKRHEEMASWVRAWAKEQGFPMFSQEGCHSPTVSCISNTKGIDFAAVKKALAGRGITVDTGYRKLNEKLAAEEKPTTFRIAHMGERTPDEIRSYLAELQKQFQVKP